VSVLFHDFCVHQTRDDYVQKKYDDDDGCVQKKYDDDDGCVQKNYGDDDGDDNDLYFSNRIIEYYLLNNILFFLKKNINIKPISCALVDTFSNFSITIRTIMNGIFH
jgi:hypothetical protein